MTQAEAPAELRAPKAAAVRKATKADAARLHAVMARAFDDDPFTNWAVKNDRRRARRIYDFMVTGYKIVAPSDEVYTTDDYDGAAYWTRPGKHKVTALRQVLLLPDMVRAVTARRLPDILAGLNAVERKHPTKPHYYLLALGVEPSLQGRGIGGALMQPILERCDREGVPAYLESSKERNVPLYERNGFRVTEEFTIPKGGPKIWLMWRDPK